MQTKFSEYLIQMFMIILGVFLGMLASEWNNTRNHENHRRDVLHAIRSELEGNLKELRQLDSMRKPFYAALDSIEDILTKDDLERAFRSRSFAEQLPKWRGIGTYNVRSSMYEAAKFSNVMPGMEIDLLEKLSRTYEKQEQIRSLHAIFLNRFFNIDRATSYQEVLTLVYQVKQELWGAQLYHEKEYELTIKTINEYLGE